jgi:hypothetical protein
MELLRKLCGPTTEQEVCELELTKNEGNNTIIRPLIWYQILNGEQ